MQTSMAQIRTTTSRGPGSRSATSSTTSGCPIASRIAARVVIRYDNNHEARVARMRAALLAELRAPFVVEDVELLDPAPGRVIVRTGATPFCSTDCINQRGELGKVPPTILGHASIGVVE